ncbi:MAG: VOC family protein [Acidimicrobiales bacterium]
MPDGAAFDHVALALADRWPFFEMFAGALAGRWVGGGESPGGFSFVQLRYANGMKVEALEALAGGSPLLDRFLAAGPGPHHLTFKVADLGAALERATALGYEPLGASLDDPWWKEAFLHPRQASGIVVQLAWSAAELDDPPPPWLPAARVTQPAELVHVAHAVSDLESALGLFKGLLGGHSVDAGAGAGLGFVDLAWPGPSGSVDGGGGRLRLLAGDPVKPWVGRRPGRLHSLCFRVADPAGVPGAAPHQDWWEVAPTPPLGVRLVLIEPGAPVPVTS